MIKPTMVIDLVSTLATISEHRVPYGLFTKVELNKKCARKFVNIFLSISFIETVLLSTNNIYFG